MASVPMNSNEPCQRRAVEAGFDPAFRDDVEQRFVGRTILYPRENFLEIDEDVVLKIST
jgi:hypothetical protein